MFKLFSFQNFKISGIYVTIIIQAKCYLSSVPGEHSDNLLATCTGCSLPRYNTKHRVYLEWREPLDRAQSQNANPRAVELCPD